MKLNLDLSGVSTMSSRVVLPTGNYPVEIVSTEAKQTAKGGGMLLVSYRVLSGEYAGSVVTDNYNIVNSNPDAQRIALSSIKTILTVGGHKNPNALADSDEMLGLKLNIYVEEEDHSFEGKDGSTVETTQNRFKGFYELNMEDVKSEPAPRKPEVKKEPAPAANPFAQPEVKPEPVEQAVAQPQAAAPSFPWQQ